MASLSRLLDTSICIYLIRSRSPGALERFEYHEVGEVGVSALTAAELRYGVDKSARPDQNRGALERFLIPLEILDFGAEAATAYSRIRSELETKGEQIGPLDTLVAAHAVALDVTLVTNNTREFERVPGLRLEDWTVGP